MKKQNKKSSKNAQQELMPLGALWKNKSKKTNIVYFTGRTEDGENIVAFVKNSGDNPKSPDLRIYFQSELEEDGEDEDDE